MWLGCPESQATDLASTGEAFSCRPNPRVPPRDVSGTSSKMLQLLRKRLRQLVRVTLVLAIGPAVAATAIAIWWLTSLNGLPDIGDPFDVAAFRAFSVPDDHNAFTYFRRASEKVTPVRGIAGSERGGPERFEILVVDREPDVAGVGRGESRGVRTVSARGRTTRRLEPGRRSHGRRESLPLDHAGHPRG